MWDNNTLTSDKHYEQKKICPRTHRPCRRPRPLCCRLLSWTAQWVGQCWRGRRGAARWARWCCGTGGGAARAAPRTASPGTASASCKQRRYDMNRWSQMLGGHNWILLKGINANRFFWDSPWKSGKTTYVPLWDQMEGAWLWTLQTAFKQCCGRTISSHRWDRV